MAAVTGPGYGYPPPEGSGARRRWLWAAVGVWGVVLIVAGSWSVRNDPPTVPEQRDIGHAVAVLRETFGTIAAAAQDERWVISLEALRVGRCSITPVRDGQEASRELSLFVPEGDARKALAGVARGLPAGYRASVVTGRGGTRLTFFADAGDQVGVEAAANSTDSLLRLRVFTGCRPAVREPATTDPPAGVVPAVLDRTVTAIGSRTPAAGAGGPVAPSGTGGPVVPVPASPGGTPGSGVAETRAVACPGGGTMSTFVRDAGPAATGSDPRGLPEGTVPVWSGAGGWAYRSGVESVVVLVDRDRLRVSVTTACRIG